MKHRHLILLPLLVGLSSCIKLTEPREVSPASIEGYAPVYDMSGSSKTISAGTPQNTVNAGKIYVKGNLLYQVESGQGIHIISIADVAHPTKIGFIKISGCEELSIKDHYLYANNINDLVVVDIADLSNPREEERMENAFHIISINTPPGRGWYECPDPTRGAVVGWTRKTLQYPECRY